jgi:signal transduction histidine kinase
MTSVRSFLLAFAGLIAINAIVAGLIWAKHRTPYYRTHFLVWIVGIVSFLAQGAASSPRGIITAFGITVFAFNLVLCDLVRRVLELRAPWRLHLTVFAFCFAVSQVVTSLNVPFWMQALPMALGTTLPLVDLLWRALRGPRRTSSVTARCALAAIALFVVHQLDFPFLRMELRFAQVGFVPAFLAGLALSVTTPAILLERTADDNARLYEAAQRALVSRDEFLMVASHELRTPLASLRLTVQGLRSPVIASSPARLGHLLKLAERQTDKMARLVDAMLSWSGPDAVRKTLHLDVTDLVAVVGHVVDAFREELTQSGSTLAIDAPYHALGNWDGSALEHALTHVLSNAIKFGGGKPIELAIEQHGSSTTCTVSDHGIGIEAERLPYVFDRFERGVSARNYGGLGLGLFIVRSIVEAHGGDVRVASTVGAGTRVALELPQGGPQA